MTLLLLAALLSTSPDSAHGQAAQLGKFAFETSCNAKANDHFQQGIGWLHSFEYEQAAQSFTQASEADSGCAIAQWGIAMSYYHPLWAPPTRAELEKASIAITKARGISAGSEREQAYIEAIGKFYRDHDRLDHGTRVLAYSSAMEALYRRFPQDREAAVFYALSLIAAGTIDTDPEFTKEKLAGAILNRVLALEPDHPGVAHYLIHSFDYPPLAELALPAARRYAAIAPAAPHAHHMPSHIFVRLGLWDEAIKSNIASEAAARVAARALGLPDSSSERLHAMDYLAYSYLQIGQDEAAGKVAAELNAIQRADPPNLAVAFAATAIPARLLLERRKWKDAASLKLPDNVRDLAPHSEFKWANAHVQFARAIGAVRGGNLESAREELAALRAIEQSLIIPAGTYDWRTQVTIERQIAEAWLAQLEGRASDALKLMKAAADLDDSAEKHPVTPGAILPAREQLGELLLEQGRPAEALAEYETSLRRAPRRLAGLYGAAQSARLAGVHAKAKIYFSQLADLAKDGAPTRKEIEEARIFVAKLARN